VAAGAAALGAVAGNNSGRHRGALAGQGRMGAGRVTRGDHGDKASLGRLALSSKAEVANRRRPRCCFHAKAQARSASCATPAFLPKRQSFTRSPAPLLLPQPSSERGVRRLLQSPTRSRVQPTAPRENADVAFRRVPGRRKQLHPHRIARPHRACAPKDFAARRGHTRQGWPKYARGCVDFYCARSTRW
jgi:hypothetical protein